MWHEVVGTHRCCTFGLQLLFSSASIIPFPRLSWTALLLHISTVSPVPGFVSLSGTSCSVVGSLPMLLSAIFMEGVVRLWGMEGCNLEGVGHPRSKMGGAGLLLVQEFKALSSPAILLLGERRGPSCGWHCRLDVHCGQKWTLRTSNKEKATPVPSIMIRYENHTKSFLKSLTYELLLFYFTYIFMSIIPMKEVIQVNNFLLKEITQLEGYRWK